jgi:hypothetical protein
MRVARIDPSQLINPPRVCSGVAQQTTTSATGRMAGPAIVHPFAGVGAAAPTPVRPTAHLCGPKQDVPVLPGLSR